VKIKPTSPQRLRDSVANLQPAKYPMRKLILLPVVLLTVIGLCLTAFGWGGNSHRFINRNAVYHLPNQMLLFIQDSLFFAQHASDADNRRVSGDTSFYAEGPRHFIDIDDYPDFSNLTRSLDTLMAQYGWERVKRNGINPWATVWQMDSLVNQLRRGDWNRAKLTASDIGHYVGDAHQPLHCAKNYDGQYSGNNGVHSRYETTMLSPTYYLSQLYITPDSVQYVSDKINFIFDYVLHSNSLIDTVLHGDNVAKAASGWNGSGTPPPAYYAALWSYTRTVTLGQMQLGTKDLSCLWYSAWVEPGLIWMEVDPPSTTLPADFSLSQNYPNPFNPATTISYTLPVGGTVLLRVFALDGREIATLIHENQSAGTHRVGFDASHLASGVYVYRLQLGGFAQARKLLVIR
ncbi:MAG: T9SS type A sorting domain-containing protein, partial [Bacteroidota bacterium]